MFEYFKTKAIYLEFYKNKLFEIRIDLGTITQAKCVYIYNELIKLFGYQQRKLNSDQHIELGYFWMGEKTSLLFIKYKNSNAIIRIISDKIQTNINNDKF